MTTRQQPETSDRPNLLLVFADQWRAQAAGYAGDLNVRTPRIDALAAESVRFTHAVSGVPVCSPYRACLLTGQYPLTHGMVVNDQAMRGRGVSLPEALNAAGYDTAYIGKWHIDGRGRETFVPPSRRLGFGFWRGFECTHDCTRSAYYADDPQRLYWEGYDAAAQTREACRYLRDVRDPARPFALVVSWGPPHNPYDTAPAPFREMYEPERITLRPNVPPEHAGAARRDLAGYYAHISALDACLGELLDALDSLALAERTVVVLTSDHGDMLGSHGLSYKQHAYDESILVPLLIRCPRGSGAGGRDEAAIVSVPDLMPTLLAMVGAVIPKTVHGRDLSRVLRGDCPAPEDDGALLTCYRPFHQIRYDNVFGDYRGLRTRRYTYVRDHDGPTMLFDNEADPYQMQNLSADPAVRPTVEALEMRLQAELAATGDEFLTGDQLAARYGIVLNGDGDVMHFPDDPAGWTSVPPRAVGCHCLWPPAFRCERRGR